MKRNKPISLIAKWKQAFAGGEKIPETEPAAAPDSAAMTEGSSVAMPSLALIRKVPVTFQLSKFENPVDFERMRFVLNACAKSTDAPFKTVLHVEQTRTGSRLVACDGVRLHVAEISKKIKSGNYKFHATKDTISLGMPLEGIKFPAWAKAIPEKVERRGIINLADSGIGKDRKETEKLSLAFNAFVKQTGEPVNLRYLGDLTKREWAVYCQDDKRKAIVLREKTGHAKEPDAKAPLAVIMPISQAA